MLPLPLTLPEKEVGREEGVLKKLCHPSLLYFLCVFVIPCILGIVSEKKIEM